MHPCLVFSHARGFAYATKKVVYNTSGHILAKGPERHQDFRVPMGVFQSLNAVRLRLRGILVNALYAPLPKIMTVAACPCKSDTIQHYLLSLRECGVWPLDEQSEARGTEGEASSIEGEARSPETFSLGFSITKLIRLSEEWKEVETMPATRKQIKNRKRRQNASSMTRLCDTLDSNLIASAVVKMHKYSDGLCLDCIADPDRWKEHRSQDSKDNASQRDGEIDPTPNISTTSDSSSPNISKKRTITPEDIDDALYTASLAREYHAYFDTDKFFKDMEQAALDRAGKPCRFDHGEGTWHFSSMCRLDK